MAKIVVYFFTVAKEVQQHMNNLFHTLRQPKKPWLKVCLNLLIFLMFTLILFSLYWGYNHDLFTSKAALENFLSTIGPIAPFIFVIIQMSQTIIPFIPASLIVPIGLFIFGLSSGFFLSFIGIISGSIINFGLARKFGRPLVEMVTSEKQLNKYIGWTEDNTQFNRLFALGMFFPFTPSDFFCYLAGLSEISIKRYLLIITFSTLSTLILFSYGLTGIIHFFF